MKTMIAGGSYTVTPNTVIEPGRWKILREGPTWPDQDTPWRPIYWGGVLSEDSDAAALEGGQFATWDEAYGAALTAIALIAMGDALSAADGHPTAPPAPMGLRPNG